MDREMSSQTKEAVGRIGEPSRSEPLTPVALTRITWLLWLATTALAGVYAVGARPSWFGGISLAGADVFLVDGFTLVIWWLATFISAIVQSYSRRYMLGKKNASGFFGRIFGFTALVGVVVAADSLVLFVAAWLGMGLVMASLIGFFDNWEQAQAAERVARRSFVLGAAFLSVAVLALWNGTGATSISAVAGAADTVPTAAYLVAVAALVGTAVVQSALLPFHGWLVSSMTAPTPASALMHAGFVNAGGVLLVRFSPLLTVSLLVMTAVVIVGATSAILGKMMMSVRADIKGKLACSTVAQMGFMILQVGLGFFAAAVAHLLLHGFYKAYMFLSSGERVEHTAPPKTDKKPSLGVASAVSMTAFGVVGGVLFLTLTGKEAVLDSGLVLAVVIVVAVAHATREVVESSVSAGVRFVLMPAVFLFGIVVYAGVYNSVTYMMNGPFGNGSVFTATPTELTPVHIAVAVGFVAAYVATGYGYAERSRRLYVRLLNASQPSSKTLLLNKEEYNES